MLNALATKELNKYYEIEKEATIIKSLERPSLATLINRFDVSRIEIAMHLDWLIEILCQTLNVTNNLNEFQKKDLVYFLLDEYKNETFEDFILCFKMAKSGRFGVIYNRIDREVVSTWLALYLELKAQQREAIVQSGKKEEFEDWDQDQIKEWYQKGQEFFKRQEELQKKNQQAEVESKIKAKENEDQFQQFRKEYLSKNSNSGGGDLEQSIGPGKEKPVSIPNPSGEGKPEPVGGKGSKHSKQNK